MTAGNDIVSFGYDHSMNQWRLTSRPGVSINTGFPRPVLSWFDDWIDPFNSLLTFAARASASPVFATAELLTGHDGHHHVQDVVLFANGFTFDLDSVTNPEPRQSRLHPGLPEFQVVWPNWVAMRQRLEVPIDLYLETLRRADQLSEHHRFLNLVQSAEALHSLTFRKTQVPPAKYLARRRAARRIMKSVGLLGRTATYKFVNSHLSPIGGNSISLRDRLDELAAALHVHQQPKATQPRFAASSATWPEWVADARNRLSHGGSSVEASWLRAASEDLERIIEHHLLQSLGYSTDRIHMVLHRRF